LGKNKGAKRKDPDSGYLGGKRKKEANGNGGGLRGKGNERCFQGRTENGRNEKSSWRETKARNGRLDTEDNVSLSIGRDE